MWRLRRSFSSYDMLYTLEEYARGLEFIENRKFNLAEMEFKRCLDILKNMQLNSENVYDHVNNRLALMFRAQGKTTQCEKTLEEIVNNCNQRQDHDRMYTAKMNLLKQYLHSNVDKAVTMENSYVPDEMKNEFLYCIGSAYALQGSELVKAKKYLSDIEGKVEYQGKVIHNLACAQWWHFNKYHEVKEVLTQQPEELEDFKQADLDFLKAIPNFQQAISCFEGLASPYELEGEVPTLKNSLCGLSMTNIAEIHYQSNKEEEFLKWARSALKFYEMNNPENIGKPLLLLGIFLRKHRQFMHAEGLLSNALEHFEHSRDFNYVMALEVFGNMLKSMPKREGEGEKMLQKAQEIKSELPYWAGRSIHMHIPQWHL